MGDAILEIDGLSKRFGKRLAVDTLTLTVNRGDIYGFLGHNGAGKSTTIRMIMGMIWPTDGAIRVNGIQVTTGRHKGNWPVGAIIESPIFYDYLSARKNLEILSSLSGGATARRIDEVLDLIGIAPRQHDKVRTFSHGMRQRLGLAQALLPGPELIILDEPLDGLDPRGIRDLRDVMLNVVQESRVTLFLSSHILHEVEMTCNRVGVIHRGKRIYEGSTQDLISVSRTVRLRTANGHDPGDLLSRLPFVEEAKRAEEGWLLTMDHGLVPEVNRQLVHGGFEVMELTPLKNRLEDVFLTLTGDKNPYEEGGA